MKEIKSIGILTGGGDCAGLNAVIRAVAKTAMFQQKWRVVGIQNSFEGILRRKTRELTRLDVSGILQLGGTILGTARGNPFEKVEGLGERGKQQDDALFEEAMDEIGIDALVCIGGDGTLNVAARLARRGIPVVGVPKTIDNDVLGTDITFGFDSASSVVMEALDRLHTTASSHHRVLVVEVMGRNAGWLALQGGVSAGGDVILIPEIEYQMENVGDFLCKRRTEGKEFSIVVVAEGIKKEIPQVDCGYPVSVAEKVAKILGDGWGFTTRAVDLGHLQRGGSPTQFDRVLGTMFGFEAARVLARGDSGRLVSWKAGELTDVPLEEASGGQRLVNPDHPLVHSARAVGTCFGDDLARMSDPRLASVVNHPGVGQ
jgi:6-phosphofructokinase 1